MCNVVSHPVPRAVCSSAISLTKVHLCMVEDLEKTDGVPVRLTVDWRKADRQARKVRSAFLPSGSLLSVLSVFQMLAPSLACTCSVAP